MKIGPVHFENPFILAPLAGYTDLAFRLLCREMGAGLVVSEMISCHGLIYGQKKTLSMLQTVPEERPWAIQLFGNEPELMGQAAALISQRPVDIIDINMGCPVRKVIKKGSGAALMKEENLQTAEGIIRAVVAHTHCPVTVKFRSGWTNEKIIATDFAQMAEAAGAAAVTLHARTWAQQFGGKADRQVITAVKKAVNIPVIGNGDILCYEDGLEMMQETGCDGVMIGRGALGNPWVFRPEGMPAPLSARLPVILRYLELAEKYLNIESLLFRIKNHTCRYLSGVHKAAEIRKRIIACYSLDEIREILHTPS
ncbi:MAG: tRNA dihydrouridine synthase DusB [Candidatus Electrothrix aestuarii]|uniref:tRNA-dihydrouridine synthase n=1 Tax=Candidatus Electrothrix aestuarii TaxID=3062594 RepID=A0AAU8LR16_9BACT|nr:tRNA dihydrouridine synthase DusB [Candidatus Electrothrix aestuarii]